MWRILVPAIAVMLLWPDAPAYPAAPADSIRVLETELAARPDDADLMFRLGREYYRRSNYDRAAFLLERGRTRTAEFGRFDRLLGTVYRLQGKFDAAADAFDRAAAAGIDDTLFRTERAAVQVALMGDVSSVPSPLETAGSAFLEFRAKAHAARGEAAIADSLFRRAIEADPLRMDLHVHRAEALLLAGLPGDALDAVAPWLAAFPDNPAGLVIEGRARHGMGETARAESLFHAAVRLEPNNADAHYRLAVLLAGGGRQEAARESYEESLRLDPGAATVWCDYARTLEALDQRELALAAYEKALDRDPVLEPAVAARRRLINAVRTETPILEATARFENFTGSGILAADDPGSIVLEIRNAGTGTAEDIRPEIAVEPETAAIQVGSPGNIGRLPAARSAILRVPIRKTGSSTIETLNLTIRISEATGFDLSRLIELSIPIK